MSKFPIAVVVVVILLLILVGQSFYTVDQTERAMVLQMGKPVAISLNPGLHFKLPFLQNVIKYDIRVQEYDVEPEEILTKDKKNLVVDNYCRWRIEDLLGFYRSVRNFSSAVDRIDDVVYGEIRELLGKNTLNEIVTSKRVQIMQEVTKNADTLLDDYGISVLDVRIKRTDLPPENRKAIYARMRSERNREANEYRAEGKEKAQEIQSAADRDKRVILAEAKKKADIIYGEGDAKSTKIYGDAYSSSSEFYSFTRSLEAYKNSLGNKTTLVLTPESDFFQYLDSSR
ncbi:MAG TPA: protease modulator HflC [Desulfohalobiaceae bacterium]|nr:protease modulator HflC [Desulfohalobiaceae bacterium]